MGGPSIPGSAEMRIATLMSGTMASARSRNSSARVSFPLGRSRREPEPASGPPCRHVHSLAANTRRSASCSRRFDSSELERSRAEPHGVMSVLLLPDPDDGGQTGEELRIRWLEPDASGDHGRIPHPLVSWMRDLRIGKLVIGRRADALDDAQELAIGIGGKGHRGFTAGSE